MKWKCKKCGDTKPLHGFYAKKGKKIPDTYICRGCIKVSLRNQYRSDKKFREEKIRSAKKYYKHNKKKMDKYHQDWRKNNPDKLSDIRKRSDKKMREKYPEKVIARQRVSIAINNGTLKRPDTCDDCGSKSKLEGHHHKGYSIENCLDVEWLCKKCHASRHS